MSPRYPNTKNSNSMRKCRNHNTVKYGQNDRHGLFCEGLIHMVCATNVNIEEPYHFSREEGAREAGDPIGVFSGRHIP